LIAIAARSKGPTYPSGHSTFGAEVTLLLGMMVPEKRAELYARLAIRRATDRERVAHLMAQRRDIAVIHPSR